MKRYVYFVAFLKKHYDSDDELCNSEVIREKKITSLQDIREIEIQLGKYGGITIVNFQLLRTEKD